MEKRIKAKGAWPLSSASSKMKVNTKLTRRIGAIGVGYMGAAILKGLLAKRRVAPSQIYVCDKIKEKAVSFAERWKVHYLQMAAQLPGMVDILLLAIKPQDLEGMRNELRPFLTKRHLVISILAGTPIAKIKQVIGEKAPIVRAMPNLAAEIGEAITALTATASPKNLELAKNIFSCCGKTVVLEESYFDLVTAASGSGPAYFFFMIELLAEFAESHGLTKKEAQTLAVQTAVGAGRLAQTSPLSPGELRKMVTSKGGTTEAALHVLENEKFSGIFFKALEAALNRGRELSQS